MIHLLSRPQLTPLYKQFTRCFQRSLSSKPKAVAFDMGGVVIPSPIHAFAQFEVKHGLPKGAIGSAIRAGGDQGKQWHAFL